MEVKFRIVDHYKSKEFSGQIFCFVLCTVNDVLDLYFGKKWTDRTKDLINMSN